VRLKGTGENKVFSRDWRKWRR